MQLAVAEPGPELRPAEDVAQFYEVTMQIANHNDAVVQITVVEPEPGKQEEAMALMAERARFMSRQPGFISIGLHRSLDGRRIVNYIQWQNRELLHAAHQAPEFRKEWGEFGLVTDGIDPHLYEVAQVFEADKARA